MRKLISLAFFFKHSRSSTLHRLHSTAGEEGYRRRNDATPAFSSSSPFVSSSSSRRNFEEESRNVKITVWWDFENCNIPISVNAHRVVNRIIWAVRSSGIRGPVTITAFGDVVQLSRLTQDALTSTGIYLAHVPHNGKNSSDRSFMADIVYWVSQNPPPVHFFLISGDKDFANILHRLRMSNYNILLASTDTASGALCSAATIMWPWNALVRGEYCAARHFNHPPDGLHGSWYGHYRGALDDPFTDADQPATLPPEEPKPRPVPKAVSTGIRQVLLSHPDGITLAELRGELKRNNVILDKDFFGYKKFSIFLASMSFLKVRPPSSSDGQSVVVRTLKNSKEVIDLKGDSVMGKTNASVELLSSSKDSNSDVRASASNSSTKDCPTIDLEASKHDSVSLPPLQTSDSMGRMAAKEGLLKKICNALTGYRFGSVLMKDDNIRAVDFKQMNLKDEVTVPNNPLFFSEKSSDLEACKHDSVPRPPLQTSSDSMAVKEGLLKKLRNTLISYRFRSVLKKDDVIMAVDSKQMNLKVEVTDPNNHLFYSEKASDSEKSTAKNDEISQSQNVGVLWRIVNWSRSWLYGARDRDDSLNHNNVHYEQFSKSHFWDEVESFLLDPKGYQLILSSRNREQLLQNLQSEGPPSLREFDIAGLSHLVDIILLDKKWLEESSSQNSPFKPAIIANKNGQILPLLVEPEPNLQKPQEHEEDQDPPLNITELKLWFQKTFDRSFHMEPEEFRRLFEGRFSAKLSSSFYGYPNVRSLIAACSAGASNLPEKHAGLPSRDKMLSDCGKLLNELFEKNPAGFNIGIFMPEFVEKYCYLLDYRTLGYPRLSALLQIIPGIRIENSHVQRSGPEATANEEDDSAWEELGPLSSPPIDENAKNYRPASIYDDKYTDSEEDLPSPSDRFGSRRKGEAGESLLLKILDSWDDSKEGRNKERKNDNLQKLRSRGSSKSCSFMHQESDKELFSERILDEVRKAGDLRLKG